MNFDLESLRTNFDHYQLRAMLAAVETRLGTDAEEQDDMDRARAIAHQLNNVLACNLLRHELSSRLPYPAGA